MGKLYIVNCTAQNIGLNYRLDFAVDGNGNRMDGRNLQALHHPIGAGQQIVIGGRDELYPEHIARIIDQLEMSWGAFPVEAVRTAKAKGVVRMIYSVDRMVPRPICEDVIAHNIGFLSDQGAERRRKLAIAMDYQLREVSQEMGSVLPPNVRTEIELEQSADDSVNNLEEGLRVDPNVPAPRRPGRPRKAA